MLWLFRKVFGCWHDPSLDNDYEIDIEKTDKYVLKIEKDEKKEIIKNIISSVISEKEKSFVSYVEEAQDAVTNSKFKFKKYR